MTSKHISATATTSYRMNYNLSDGKHYIVRLKKKAADVLHVHGSSREAQRWKCDYMGFPDDITANHQCDDAEITCNMWIW